jgi:arylsulfatase A-like enzyme
LYPHANGCTENNISLRPGTPCFPEMIAEGRYVTGHFGKWHLGDELFAQHGFAHWVSIEDGYNAYFGEGRNRNATSTYHDFLTGRGLVPKNGRSFGRSEAARLTEHLGKPAFLARQAAEFIQTHRRQPFILYVNFLEPHMPFFGPRDSQHPVDGIPLPPNFADEPTDAQPLKTRLLAEHYRRHGQSGLPLRTEADWRRMIANYWGLCSLVDTHVGAILETVETCGLSGNTVVAFTSDHGDMMGAHRLIAKCVQFQEAIRVPLLIRLPGQSTARRIAGPVSQIDIVPTLLELLGESLPGFLQGQSLSRAMERGRTDQEEVYIEWNGPNNGLGDVCGQVQFPDWLTSLAPAEAIRAACADPVRTVIRADGWKLNLSPLGEHELYNLRQDPGEMLNRFGEKAYARVARELASSIRSWQKRTGDMIEFRSR